MITFLFYLFVVVVGVPAVIGALVAGWCVVDEIRRAARAVLGPDAPVDHLIGYAPAEGEEAAKSGRDPAYRSYLLGPVLQDVRELIFSAADRAWTRTVKPSDEGALVRRVLDLWSTELTPGWQVALFPVLVAAEIGVAVGYGAAFAVVELVLLVFGASVGVVAALAGLAMVVLRWLEKIVLRVRGITVECGNCHRRVVAPAYDCPGCDAAQPTRHRRLIPGRLGVLWRICRCGERLPTLLLLGKGRLTAYCQHDGCNHALPAGGLTTPTFHVPIVAGTSAGKTVLMLAAVAELEAGPDGLEFADEARAEEVRGMLATVRTDGVDAVAKTLPDQPLRPLTLYLGSPARTLLYLYDAAGERFESSERLEVLRSLQHTAGVVFVVDPFALSTVRTAAEQAVLERARPSETDPTDVAEDFTSSLRARLELSAGRKIEVAAAVALTKCDALLAERSIRHPYDDLDAAATSRDARSKAVYAWLNDYGAGQLVDHLDNNYQRTSLFAVSGLDVFEDPVRTSARTGTDVRNDDPAAPVRWLLDPEEVR